MGIWQLQVAKSRLSDVIKTSKTDGPQIITQRGVKSAVIIPFDQWERSQQKNPESLLDILRSGPPGELPIPSRKSWRVRKPVEL